ncbi:alpha-1,6-mannosyl-glycoprotein 4-beta-N-acetylglucosaminyltransferase isoform X3 [Strix uralensis]|uniref:alpha-1,6-mannosyl-glycoprotein 4-beta-N-acetylglucosaminyltransferase isoform X3 n=1 Tax=Strix uralensis TaxID=36305 RepID=UPI003DA6D537
MGRAPTRPPLARGDGRGFVPSQCCAARRSGQKLECVGKLVPRGVHPGWDPGSQLCPGLGCWGLWFWLSSPGGFCCLSTRAEKQMGVKRCNSSTAPDSWLSTQRVFTPAPPKWQASACRPGAMRCSLKRYLTAALTASFLLLLLFLLHGGSQQEQDPLEVELRGLAPATVLQMLQPEGAQRILQNTDDLSALHNVSYHLLAGSLSPHKKFLAVGLASVRRPRGYYLPATLQSLFKQSTEEELQEMVVVVHLADADPRWNMRVAANIAHKFAHHILLGRLLLIHAPHESYPTLKGLKRNYNDPEERVRFRSKQNVDYAFLLAFAANLSSYYLMIEDDVWCAKSFLTAIRKALASQEGSNWATLEFSKLGYIGKLYRSSDLPRLAHFLLLFYQEMPCDWLLVHFRLLLTQKDVIRFKPSLFQHMGLYSSFQGTVNRLEDDEFQADALDLPDNPPAAVFTSMSVFENYEPLKAYSTAEGYFWGVLELGRRRRADGRDCSAYTTVGTFEKGTFEQRGLERGTPGPVECVRIRVTRDQSEWLIIQSIDVWTASGT